MIPGWFVGGGGFGSGFALSVYIPANILTETLNTQKDSAKSK